MSNEKRLGLKQYIRGGSFDTFFFACVFIMLTVGIIMMFSASYVSASFKYDDPMYFFKGQVKYACIGIIGMLLISRIDLKLFRKMTPVIVVASFVLLSLVYVFPYTLPGRGAIHRWANIPGIGTFQPSELAKFALITLCAKVLADQQKKNKLHPEKKDFSILICIVATLVYCGVVFAEKHVSGTLLLFAIGCVMIMLGGIDRKWIIIGLSVAVVGVLALVLFHDVLIDKLPIPEYAKLRIESMFNKDYTDHNERWQTNQSLYAIGSGGLFGQGLGKSKQKHLYMPEPQNDFVFAIVCEELGFVGAVLVLVGFAVLIWRGFVIGIKSHDRFTALLVMGIMSHVGLQTILNILVVTDAIPNTGIGLPFFSYGGTSLVVLLGEMGVVLSASRQSTVRKR